MAATHETGVARPFGPLPAAGAFDPAPISINSVSLYKQISFLIRYTRGAAAGAVRFKVEFSEDMINWYTFCALQPPTVTPGADSDAPTQRTTITYQATGPTEELFMSPTFTISATHIRIVMAESGAVGTPGNVEALYYIRGDQG